MIEVILLDPFTGYIVAGALVITALVKKLFVNAEEGTPEYKKQTRFLPLVSFIIGFVPTLFFFTPMTVATIVGAVLVGGSAAGIYDLGKKSILGK